MKSDDGLMAPASAVNRLVEFEVSIERGFNMQFAV
jgi:hypothetical protein